MPRYIDIDKMHEWDRESNGCEGIENCLGKRFSDCMDCYYDHGGAEDVAPVIHAKWIVHDYEKTNNRLDMEFPYECSNCNHRQGLFRYKYCHNCGAKMDKE